MSLPLLVFTYAPAGLGHLRVTQALLESKPPDYPYVLMGYDDVQISRIHRFTSINPAGKAIFEAFQSGVLENIGTAIYKSLLHRQGGTLLQQFINIAKQYQPHHILVLSTHFGLAHKLGAIKDQFERQTEIPLRLIVQVTDDTPLHIWCVPEADLILVPSANTRDRMRAFAQSKNYPVRIENSPYPVSPKLSLPLSTTQNRSTALHPQSSDPIRIAFPVSGAATGLPYQTIFLNTLHSLNSRFHIHLISKETPFTSPFLSLFRDRAGFTVHSAVNDIDVVTLYEKVYQDQLIHLETTKPSEQAFKCLLSPSAVGGSLLLFNTPVGRQENDNLDFMRRHSLIPVYHQQTSLLSDFRSHSPSFPVVPSSWRGITFPNSPLEAAAFTDWLLHTGVFYQMATKYQPPTDLYSSEVSDAGSKIFWQQIHHFLDLHI